MIAPHPTPAEIRYPPAMRDVSESPRFQVSVNGVVQTTCGTGRLGTLMILLTWGARDADAPEHARCEAADLGPWLHLDVGGHEPATDMSRTWLRMDAFELGDVIAVRVLEPGPIDAPLATFRLREGPSGVAYRRVVRGDAPRAERTGLDEVRFDVRSDGERRGTIGVGRFGVVVITIEWSPLAGEDGAEEGAVVVALGGNIEGHGDPRRWPLLERLACGQEASFEILGPGPSDPPAPRDVDQPAQNERSPAKDVPPPGP